MVEVCSILHSQDIGKFTYIFSDMPFKRTKRSTIDEALDTNTFFFRFYWLKSTFLVMQNENIGIQDVKNSLSQKLLVWRFCHPLHIERPSTRKSIQRLMYLFCRAGHKWSITFGQCTCLGDNFIEQKILLSNFICLGKLSWWPARSNIHYIAISLVIYFC